MQLYLLASALSPHPNEVSLTQRLSVLLAAEEQTLSSTTRLSPLIGC
jgi:hypothetical protein